MTDSPLIAGLDVGTTNVKALIAEPDGTVVALASTPTPCRRPEPGRAHYEPDEIWNGVLRVLREATSQIREPARIMGLAVASVGETGFPVDASGEPAYPGIAWFDTRSEPQARWLKDEVGDDRIYNTCRMPIQPIFGLCKLLWLRDNAPDAFKRTATWLNTADFVAFRLSGEKATDYSLASRTLLFDIAAHSWSAYLLNLANLSPNTLAPLVRSGTPLGQILPHVADATGLPKTCTVAVGGHDHICGALGVGVVEPGDVLNSLGTAEAVFVPTERPTNDPVLGRQGYSVGSHVAWDRYYLIGGLYSSGDSVDWVSRLLGNLDREDLLARAKQSPPGAGGVTFLPHLRMANPPFGDAPSRAAFIGLTGDTEPSDVYRAVLEGISFESRLCLDGMRNAAPAGRIIAIGGSTRNDLLMEIKSSIFGRPITIAQTEEAVALGAAVLGGLGAGTYSDIDHAVASLKVETRTIDPDPLLVERYETLFGSVYRHLYPSLSQLNERIHDVQGDRD